MVTEVLEFFKSISETVPPSFTQDINIDDVWDTLVDHIKGITSIPLQDLCSMSSCLKLVMVLLENNTIESALVDIGDVELQFTVTEEDIHKGIALLQHDEQKQMKQDKEADVE